MRLFFFGSASRRAPSIGARQMPERPSGEDAGERRDGRQKYRGGHRGPPGRLGVAAPGIFPVETRRERQGKSGHLFSVRYGYRRMHQGLEADAAGNTACAGRPESGYRNFEPRHRQDHPLCPGMESLCRKADQNPSIRRGRMAAGNPRRLRRRIRHLPRASVPGQSIHRHFDSIHRQSAPGFIVQGRVSQWHPTWPKPSDSLSTKRAFPKS